MSGSSSAIKQPGTIWAKLVEQNAAQQKKPDGRGDAYCYFVGSRLSGKSTLLNRFLYPRKAEPPKPSEGLEYVYARKANAFDHEKKDIAHIWEVGGSTELSEEVATADQIFITAKQVTTAVVIIVVDLSDPASVLPACLTWLDLVKKKLAVTYEKYEKKGLQLPEQLRQRSKAKLYGSNEDKDVVTHTGIPIVIAATKYDLFQEQDAELRKVMARTLRYVAHMHSASLMYVSSLHDPALHETDPLLGNFNHLLSHLLFTGLERKPTFKAQPQYDHTGPLMVLAGSDRFKDIGQPRGGFNGHVESGLQEWKELYEKLFPPRKDKAKAKFEMDEMYAQDEIDKVRERKLQELEQARKEQEISKPAKAKKSSKPKEGSSKRTGEAAA